MTKPITLADWQIRALELDGELLIVVPLEMPPPENWELWPPHAPGDRLWVQEEWYSTHINPVAQNRTFYRAGCDKLAEEMLSVEWQPADTMPEWASRYTLEVTAVTVKRLQDMTEEEAQAAGYKTATAGFYCTVGGDNVPIKTHLTGMRYQWRDDGRPDWASNPWCALAFTKDADR